LRLLGAGCAARSTEGQATPLKPASSCSFQGRTVTPIDEVKEINMKNLKRLGAAVALTFVLGVSVFAGDISTPPCAPPAPGIMETPPCAAQAISDDSTAPGQTDTPPASNAIDMPSFAEAAMNLLLLF
jgi:hypothetical protein